jgi:hypothetical protein
MRFTIIVLALVAIHATSASFFHEPTLLEQTKGLLYSVGDLFTKSYNQGSDLFSTGMDVRKRII